MIRDTVSIHAPAWGATTTKLTTVLIALFQSTRPRGARHAMQEELQQGRDVSIHAPAWGATLRQAVPPQQFLSFNPRARVGRDPVPYHW